MLNALLYPALISLCVCCTITLIAWIWAIKIKNGGVIDIFWSFNFPVIAILLLFISNGFPVRVWLICIMVIVWGLRLAFHLGVRVVNHLDQEEGRYAQLRKEWAPHENRKLFWFFQAQGVSNVLLAVPFLLITGNQHDELVLIEYIAATVWLIALSGEAAADWQLKRFKADLENEGKVCNVGLWHYSRHPNYFFEWLIWLSYFLFALGSPFGYVAIVSPAIMLYLLLRVTGIPATEEQALRSKGRAYQEYQQTTSSFIPWFPKRLD